MSFTRVRVLLVLPMLLAGCAGGACVRLTRAAGLVFVELRAADGGNLLALLDTAATASAVDSRWAATLPMVGRDEVLGTTGAFTAEMVRVEGLRLAGFALPTLRATRRPLDGLLAPAGRRLDMILGADAFVGATLRLDFTRDEVTLQASSGDQSGMALSLDHGIPLLPARLGGVDLDLRVDTGASLFASDDVYVNVTTATWRALQQRNPGLQSTSHLTGTGADGATVDLPVARVAEARIGPIRLPGVFVIVQPQVGYFAQAEAVGFVGNNFLEKLGWVEFDFAGRRLRAAVGN